MRALSILVVAASSLAAQTLDYQFFKERVQPIFLKQRTGHARCISCHAHGSPPLEPLAPGAESGPRNSPARTSPSGNSSSSPATRSTARCCSTRSPNRPAATASTPAASTGLPRATPNGRRSPNGSPPASCGNCVLQSNSAGDDIHLIDADTNRVVGVIQGIEVPHGVAIAPGGARIYVTNEALRTLDVVDARSLKVTKRVPLSGRPNNLAVGKDGRWVYVGIREEPGAVDIIDTAAFTKAKTIPVKGGIHNVYVTPDGKFAVAGSISGKLINVIDTITNELVVDACRWTPASAPWSSPPTPTARRKTDRPALRFPWLRRHRLRGAQGAPPRHAPRPARHARGDGGTARRPAHGFAITPDGEDCCG